VIWELAIRPLLFMLPAESVHDAAMGTYSFLHRLPSARNLIRRHCRVDDRRLRTTVFGIDFENPVGLAAGFDKNAYWFRQLASLGFGHIEIGTITGQAQLGNPKPRLFRLPQDNALINRMGFNNPGSNAVAQLLGRLKHKPGGATKLGINIGKTKAVPIESATDDYLTSMRRLHAFADYFTINVSSPNTPGLRKLQDREPLKQLISAVTELNMVLSNSEDNRIKPILLKIAPDLNDEQLTDIAEIALESNLSGIIATNTTTSRDGLKTPTSRLDRIGSGGLSGAPLTSRSAMVVKKLYSRLENAIPIVGVGGIMTPEDAWNMICNGAALIQVYTGFAYGGPTFVNRINRFLLQQLESQGIASIGEAVGRASSPDFRVAES
jgi:dihydroorotate dehydrogenase